MILKYYLLLPYTKYACLTDAALLLEFPPESCSDLSPMWSGKWFGFVWPSCKLLPIKRLGRCSVRYVYGL